MSKLFNKSALLVLLSAMILIINGCASIVHGTTEAEVFTSSPSGAHVKIDGRNYGHTPVNTSLERGKDHTVEISLPGYKPATFTLEKHVSGWFFGNIIFGGIIGLVVDAADGAMYKLTPSQLSEVSGGSMQASDNSINIVLVKQVPSHMKKHKVGQLKKR